MTRSDIEATVRSALQQLTDQDISTIDRRADLRAAIGLDSLGRLELLAEVEDRFDLFFSEANTEDATTISAMVDMVDRALNETKELV